MKLKNTNNIIYFKIHINIKVIDIFKNGRKLIKKLFVGYS